jgi:hypothetical protein
MLEVKRRSVERREVVGSRTVLLAAAETTIMLGSRTWSAAWTYRRPLRVSIDGEDGTSIPVHDHVMLARLAIVLATTLLAMTRRR